MSMARVLVIEDEANNLDVAQRIIRAAGHEALVAMDGQTGLDVARAEHPDAILVDLLLPRVDGWTITRTLRAEQWAARIPIIAVSALAMQQDRQRAIDAGCDDFVSKPYAPAELRAVLARFLPEGAAVPAGAKRGDASAPPPSLGTVLAVDDEPANLELISRRLAALGCKVVRASNGEQALGVAEREHLDLILLDVMMPGIDGWETCRRLKSNERTADVPVIFVTARDRTEDVVTGFEAGGVDYVSKPFEPIELAARVRSALFMKRLQDQLRASNQELKKVERSRQELIGMLGHDIRNLANSVVAFLQLVGMGQLDPSRPEFAELLGLSESNVSELLRMVNALLDVYKLEEGRLEAIPQAIRLEELARKSIAQVTPEARAKNISITCDVGAATVFVDDGLIVRVLTNLLANAVKHTPAEGTARVSARVADEGKDFVVIRVTDSGPGIPTEDAPNVFDRFYQGEGGRSRGGTGLGLAFCRLAIALHGGTIRVANPGEPGAIMELTLPAAAADHAAGRA
ncbi:MAG TPA: response regulator [Candidatus Limnocylindria bacterium]|jgi:CheY-like chemotaxis protein|nr:response regulator [Candidatus Limnocylindria bacterium]